MKGLPSESTRTYVSLALFMHLFCVAAVLSGNFFPSSLQSKLMKAVGIYTKTLHLDPGWVSFHLTDGEAGLTGFYRWQIVETNDNGPDKVVRELPGREQPMRGGFRRLRHEAFARMAASYSSGEVDDEVCATMARALANHYFNSAHRPQGGGGPVTRLIVRCVGADFTEESASATDSDESSAALYEANAWLSDDGKVNVLKRMEARRVAPPVIDSRNRQ